jgi:hypothetical protein
VHAGEGVLIPTKAEGASITPPKAYDWTKNLNWKMDPAEGDVEDQSSLDSAYQSLLKSQYD